MEEELTMGILVREKIDDELEKSSIRMQAHIFTKGSTVWPFHCGPIFSKVSRSALSLAIVMGRRTRDLL